MWRDVCPLDPPAKLIEGWHVQPPQVLAKRIEEEAWSLGRSTD
jgi:hypothetical protein